MINALNPTQKCFGPTMNGCPSESKAEPNTEEMRDGLRIMTSRYHCAPCFEIYRRKYG